MGLEIKFLSHCKAEVRFYLEQMFTGRKKPDYCKFVNGWVWLETQTCSGCVASSALDLVHIKIQRSGNLAKHDVSISASNTPV